MFTNHAQLFKKLPSWIYKLGAQTWIDHEFPRHLFVETTASCNLKCDYCPRERINSHMDFNLFRAVVDEARCYGPRSFSLHLFGEPLLYPRWREAVAYIKQANRKNTVLFTSNGTLIERYIDDLLDSGIDKFLWSWRPEPKWSDKTKWKLRRWKSFTVRIIEEVTPDEAKEEYSSWPRIERRNLHNYGGEIQLERFGARNTVGKRWPCYHLWLAPAVSWNGKFLMCCVDSHQKEVFGDVEKETVNECWKRLDGVRESHLRGSYDGICAECDVWKAYPDLFFSWQKTKRP